MVAIMPPAYIHPRHDIRKWWGLVPIDVYGPLRRCNHRFKLQKSVVCTAPEARFRYLWEGDKSQSKTQDTRALYLGYTTSSEMAMSSFSWILLACFLLATVFSAVYSVPVSSSSDNVGRALPDGPLFGLVFRRGQPPALTYLDNRQRRDPGIPDKYRRASVAEPYPMWEGMMDSLDTLQKPRFGR